MMEAARTSETLENFYQTTRRYNPEDSHLPINKWLLAVTKVSTFIPCISDRNCKLLFSCFIQATPLPLQLCQYTSQCLLICYVSIMHSNARSAWQYSHHDDNVHIYTSFMVQLMEMGQKPHACMQKIFRHTGSHIIARLQQLTSNCASTARANSSHH
jgi:hypothetical protein